MKATHYGTCQICGRKQKAPNGLVAKHGYTVDGGYFNGTCFGSDEKPFERERIVLGREIERLAKNIGHRKSHLTKVKEGTEPVLAIIRFRNPEDKWGYRSEKAWVQIISETDEGIVIDKDHAPSNKEPDPIYYPREVKTNEDGNWVINKEGYDWKEQYVAYLDRRIHIFSEILKDMESRYDSWERKELEPIITRLMKETSV